MLRTYYPVFRSGCPCVHLASGKVFFFLFFSFFHFIPLITDGPHHYHPGCGRKGSSHLSPVHALQFFYRDASSALLQLVNQWLNITYSCSHAFCCERKNTNPTLVRIEPTTYALAGVQVTYQTTRATTAIFISPDPDSSWGGEPFSPESKHVRVFHGS